MALDINSLFTPAASGVSQSSQSTSPASGTWLSQILQFATDLGLQTTSWQPGGEMRTILAIVATLMSQEDVIVSIMAQGGFLDYAASGSVSAVALNGVTVTIPVTPDPSIPAQNSTGALGWLDILADSVYDVQRISATFASNTIAIANSTATAYGPFGAGTYHVSSPTTGASYANTQSLSIAPRNLVGGGVTGAVNGAPITITTASAHGLSNASVVDIQGVAGNTAANGTFGITVLNATQFLLHGSSGSGSYVSGGTVNVCTTTTFRADNIGPVGSATPGSITTATTALIGVTVKNLVTFVGQNWESNLALAKRCRLKLQSLSPNGSAGAYEYFALSAAQLLSEQTPPVTLSGGAITRVLVQASPVTGVVTTTIANASGAVAGVSNLAITGATNLSPIVITTAVAHTLTNGDFVTITGVLGNSNANGTWVITSVDGTHFSLNGSTGNATYTAGGIVEGGDLGQVDTILQAKVVPNGTTAITQSAAPFGVAITGTVIVPLGQVSTYLAAMQTALAQHFQNLPIGGVNAVGLSYEDIIGVLYAAGSVAGQKSFVVDMTSILVNGVATDLAYPSPTYVATITSTTIVVTGI